MKNSNSKVSELSGQVENLRRQLTKAQDETKSALDTGAALQRKAERIDEVQQLSYDLRRWLQGYYHESTREGNEIHPVILLSSLVNFSLCQMCFSIMDDSELLFNLMAHNLRLVERFGQSSGGETSELLKRLIRIAPKSADMLDSLKESDYTRGRMDDPL